MSVWLAVWPTGALAQTADPEPVHQASSQGDTGSGTPSGSDTQHRNDGDTHMFGVLPNYGTVDDPDNAQPISAKEKMRIEMLSAFAPIVYPFAAVGAAVNMEFGPGAKGYAKQYAASLADTIGGNMMTSGVMPSLFRMDPRYFRKREGSGWARTRYAASRVFVGRTDHGRHVFNVTEFGGIAVSTAISNLYYPPGSQTLGGDAKRMALQLMWDGTSNILKEFWPDIRDWMRRRKTPKP